MYDGENADFLINECACEAHARFAGQMVEEGSLDEYREIADSSDGAYNIACVLLSKRDYAGAIKYLERARGENY